LWHITSSALVYVLVFGRCSDDDDDDDDDDPALSGGLVMGHCSKIWA